MRGRNALQVKGIAPRLTAPTELGRTGTAVVLAMKNVILKVFSIVPAIISFLQRTFFSGTNMLSWYFPEIDSCTFSRKHTALGRINFAGGIARSSELVVAGY